MESNRLASLVANVLSRVIEVNMLNQLAHTYVQRSLYRSLLSVCGMEGRPSSKKGLRGNLKHVFSCIVVNTYACGRGLDPVDVQLNSRCE